MRKTILALGALLMFSGSATAGLVLTLDSPPVNFTDAADCEGDIGGGTSPCILFTGSILDTDTDSSYLAVSGITITFTDPDVTYFTQDSAFSNNVPGLFQGDPNWATDNSGSLPNSYSGVIFGLEFPIDTVGDFQFTAQLQGSGGTDDPSFSGIVSNTVTSDIVIPEPATSVLPLSAAPILAVFAALRRRRSRV